MLAFTSTKTAGLKASSFYYSSDALNFTLLKVKVKLTSFGEQVNRSNKYTPSLPHPFLAQEAPPYRVDIAAGSLFTQGLLLIPCSDHQHKPSVKTGVERKIPPDFDGHEVLCPFQ